MGLRSLLFKTDEPVERPVSKAERRVKALATHDLVPWADQCLYTIGRSLNDWSRDAARLELLSEAQEGMDALQVIMAELQQRAAQMATSGPLTGS